MSDDAGNLMVAMVYVPKGTSFLHKIINYVDMLNQLRKLVKNWYEIPFQYVGRKTILYTNQPQASILVRDNSDLSALIDIIGKNAYFYEDVKIEENDKVILDIGAHIGLFSIVSALMNNRATVYAYEPFPKNYTLLLYNLKLNKLLNRVKLKNYALNSTKGETKLYIANSNLSHSMTPNKWNVEGKIFIPVKSVTFESMFHDERIQRVDFMKVNCEGCEYDILREVNAYYLDKIHKLAIQCHNFDSNHNYLIIRSFLKQFGFKVYTKHYDNKHTYLFAKK